MRPMLSSDPFVKRLILALGLPAGVRSFELSAGVDRAVVVKCEYYADADLTAGFDPKPLVAEFQLVRMTTRPVIPQPRPARRANGSLAVAAAAVCLAPLLVLLAAWLAGR